MKTKTVISSLTLFLMIFFCSTMLGQKNDLKKLNLNGNVKSIREFSSITIENFGDIQKDKAKLSYYNIYSNNGNKIEDNRYNSDGSLNKKFTYKYDSTGNRIEQNQFTSDDSLIRKITYKHDKQGNIIEDNSYTPDGNLDKKFTYKYNNKGNRIENSIFTSQGNLDKKFIYKYDDKGNVIEENCYSSDGSLLSKDTYKYEYDNHQNWNRQTGFEDEKPKYIIEREIEYY